MKPLGRARLLTGVGALTIAATPALVASAAVATPALVASAQAGEAKLTIHAHPSHLRRGHRLMVDGRLGGATGPLAGALVELQQAPLHRGSFRDIAHATTGAGGIYRFARLRPQASTRYRVRPASL